MKIFNNFKLFILLLNKITNDKYQNKLENYLSLHFNYQRKNLKKVVIY